MKVMTRPIRKEDGPFIFATYLRQLWFAKDNATLLPKDTFMRLHHRRIEEEILKGGTILCLENDPDLILGYKLGGFKYFKKHYRGMGLEEML